MKLKPLGKPMEPILCWEEGGNLPQQSGKTNFRKRKCTIMVLPLIILWRNRKKHSRIQNRMFYRYVRHVKEDCAIPQPPSSARMRWFLLQHNWSNNGEERQEFDQNSLQCHGKQVLLFSAATEFRYFGSLAATGSSLAEECTKGLSWSLCCWKRTKIVQPSLLQQSV